jgi:hypothetical protein
MIAIGVAWWLVARRVAVATISWISAVRLATSD